jgi:hypothetical protein
VNPFKDTYNYKWSVATRERTTATWNVIWYLAQLNILCPTAKRKVPVVVCWTSQIKAGVQFDLKKLPNFSSPKRKANMNFIDGYNGWDSMEECAFLVGTAVTLMLQELGQFGESIARAANCSIM